MKLKKKKRGLICENQICLLDMFLESIKNKILLKKSDIFLECKKNEIRFVKKSDLFLKSIKNKIFVKQN